MISYVANPENIGSVVSSNNVPLNLNLQTTLDAYETAIQNAFGLTIEHPEDSLIPDYVALEQYHEGADLMATLFDELVTANLQDVNRYTLFQAIKGQITVERTATRPVGNVDGNGLSEGHVIKDFFDELRQGYGDYYPEDVQNQYDYQPMTALNFAHELAHSFNAFSGMGSFLLSLQASQVEDLWAIMQNTEGTVAENPDSLLNPGEFPEVTTEVLADYLLNMALGNVPINNDFMASIRQAVLYHTSGEQQSPFVELPGISVPIVEGINPAGIRIGVEGNQQVGSIPKNIPDTDVRAFGQFTINPDTVDAQTWIYVGYEIQIGNPLQTVTQYGWVQDFQIVGGNNLDVPILSVESVDPFRPFTTIDPINPTVLETLG